MPRNILPQSIRQLVHKRDALLKQLAPLLRRVNPYSKTRSVIEKQRRAQKRALLTEIDSVEKTIVAQVTQWVHLPSNNPTAHAMKQRERRRNDRLREEIFTGEEHDG